MFDQRLEGGQVQQENQITVIYDTMWDSTRKMAEAIADGIRQADNTVAVKLFNCARADKNDIIAEVFKSRAILAGSPTINKGILSHLAGILEEIRGLSFKNKKAAAFGSYGWSGEACKMAEERLKGINFKLPVPFVRAPFTPRQEALEKCEELGRIIAEEVLKKQ